MGQNDARKIFKKCQSGDGEVDSKCLFGNRGHKEGRKRLLKEDQLNAQIRAERKDGSLALTSGSLKDEPTEEAVLPLPSRRHQSVKLATESVGTRCDTILLKNNVE